MPAVSPSISPEIYRIAPGFRALSICVKAAPVADERVGEVALREACEAAQAGQPAWAEAHLSAWAEVFRAFGETVEKRLRPDTDKARRPTRRRTGKEAGR